MSSKAALIWEFVKTRKKWWLGPIMALLLVFGLVTVLAEASPLAPFIYTLF